jgi:hypothetical protein
MTNRAILDNVGHFLAATRVTQPGHWTKLASTGIYLIGRFSTEVATRRGKWHNDNFDEDCYGFPRQQIFRTYTLSAD